MDQVTFRVPAGLPERADELAAELGVTRSDVMREALESGMSLLLAEWETALENGKRKGGKKRASA
jgi:predicted DNA-binding protein